MRGETSVFTQISPLKIRGKNEYILIFPGGKMSILADVIFLACLMLALSREAPNKLK
jgi:hypothetical protein